LPRGFRALLFRWLDLFHVSPRAGLKNELAKIHGASVHFEAPYRGYAWLTTIRRQPAVPQSRGP
jgi:S-adenosylmethionine-diacylgycerolhomoserine-N-methlytransferase